MKFTYKYVKAGAREKLTYYMDEREIASGDPMLMEPRFVMAKICANGNGISERSAARLFNEATEDKS